MKVTDLLRFTLPGMWYNWGELFADKTGDSFLYKILNGLLGSKNPSEYITYRGDPNKYDFNGNVIGSVSDPSNGIEDYIDSYLKSVTGAGPNGLQLWQASREDSAYQRGVADMEKAGLNSALMYGNGAQPSASSAGGSSSVGISDLLQLAMLPLQMQAMQADINNTNANTQNTIQRTRTEEQNTLVQSLVAEWLPTINEKQLAVMQSSVDKAYSEVAVNESRVDLINSEKSVQDIVAEYLPAKNDAELKRIKAETSKLDADAALAIVRKDFEKIQYNFARDNHFLMSSSDTLLVVVYIASLLGISTESVANFIQNEVPQVVQQVSEDTHMYGPGGPHK